MSLRQWHENGWLQELPSSQAEITGLLGIAERNIEQCRLHGLDPDWKLQIAFQAVLAYATIALRASGYRAHTQSHHYHTIESLQHTLRLDEEFLDTLRAYSKKRNQSAYQVAGNVSVAEADELLGLVLELRKKTLEWLECEHPEMLPSKWS